MVQNIPVQSKAGRGVYAAFYCISYNTIDMISVARGINNLPNK